DRRARSRCCCQTVLSPPQLPLGRPVRGGFTAHHQGPRHRPAFCKQKRIITQLVNRAASADLRAVKILLDLLRDIEAEIESAAAETSAFSEADEKVLEQLRARFSVKKSEQ